jgi:Flp pilus assembly pilin Flp
MNNRREFAQLFFDEKGTAAIEFGLVGTFLSLLMIGLVDFGMGYWEQMQVGNAARAGAEYVIANSTTWNSSAVLSAVTSATSLPSGSITATVSTPSCGCPNVSGGITAGGGAIPTCGVSCASGGTSGAYVTIAAQASYSPILTYTGIIFPPNLTATTTVRYN